MSAPDWTSDWTECRPEKPNDTRWVLDMDQSKFRIRTIKRLHKNSNLYKEGHSHIAVLDMLPSDYYKSMAIPYDPEASWADVK